MKKATYITKNDLLEMEVGEHYNFNEMEDIDSGDLCEIHRVLTGWIYVFTDSETFVPDVLNLEVANRTSDNEKYATSL
jgi:hypothetical protein